MIVVRGNQGPKPFLWTASIDTILERADRRPQHLESTAVVNTVRVIGQPASSVDTAVSSSRATVRRTRRRVIRFLSLGTCVVGEGRLAAAPLHLVEPQALRPHADIASNSRVGD